MTLSLKDLKRHSIPLLNAVRARSTFSTMARTLPSSARRPNRPIFGWSIYSQAMAPAAAAPSTAADGSHELLSSSHNLPTAQLAPVSVLGLFFAYPKVSVRDSESGKVRATREMFGRGLSHCVDHDRISLRES